MWNTFYQYEVGCTGHATPNLSSAGWRTKPTELTTTDEEG